MNITEIRRRIQEGTVTTEDFNLFIESLPRSTDERRLRRSRLKPGDPIRPKDTKPVAQATHGVRRKGNNDPTKTARGKASVRKQGKRNKKNKHKFAEAARFIRSSQGRSLQECIERLPEVSDKDALYRLACRLEPRQDFDPSFIRGLKLALEESYV